MLDVDYDEQQRSYAEAIAAFCAVQTEAWSMPRVAAGLDMVTWAALGELGVLGLTVPDSGAEALDVVAAHEALGVGGCPGPLWATVLAAAVLGGTEQDELAAGRVLVTVGRPELMPWAEQAAIVLDSSDLEAGGKILWRCTSVEVERRTILLGLEPAASIRCRRGERIEVRPGAVALAELALAAYLTGAARRVISEVAAYVRTRRQFRRPLSQFQAVAHPLAECDARVRTSAALVRRAAAADEGELASDAVVALASAARSARGAVYQAHQAYGGIGFAEEGPLSWLGSRVAQLSTQAEALARTHPIEALLPS